MDRTTPSLRLLPALLLLGLSCAYDLDVPIHNNAPEIVGARQVTDTLLYPNAVLCTLSVSDLNDTRLDVSMRCRDSASAGPSWTMQSCCLNQSYGEKRIALSFPGSILGPFHGVLYACDDEQACDSIDLSLERMFVEPFDSLPLSPTYWTGATASDPNHIAIDYPYRRLKLNFDQSITDSTTPDMATVVSRFRLSGNSSVSVDFELRDDMYDGFEVGFYAATTADTGQYPGRYFGIFLDGQGSWVNVKCKSVSYQTDIQPITFYTGVLSICRVDSTVTFTCTPDAPGIAAPSLPAFSFPAHDSLYLHLTMRETDHRRIRHCTWDNLTIHDGILVEASP